MTELSHRRLGAGNLEVSRIALGSWRTFERMERRHAERVLGYALEATGASLVPSAALAGGALSGKYAGGQAGRLSTELEDPARRRALALGAALAEPARRLRTTPATLAIAFTLTHPRAAAHIDRRPRPEQIDAAIVALAERLSAEDLAQLRELAHRTG